MYAGRLAQGAELYLTVRTTTAGTFNPDVPRSAPFVQVYRDGSPPTKLETRYMAAYQPGLLTGVFRASIFFGALYGTAGRHLLVVRWTDSGGNPVTLAGGFELLAGGAPEGALIAMHEVVRPDARYLIGLTDGGQLVRRKNPR